MKADPFLKFMVVVIALLLGMIVARPWLKPTPVVADSAGKLEDVQMWCIFCDVGGTTGGSGILLFSSKTGDLWLYPEKAVKGEGKPEYIGTLPALGEPISKRAASPPAPPLKKKM
jgi:hypothetical protein